METTKGSYKCTVGIQKLDAQNQDSSKNWTLRVSGFLRGPASHVTFLYENQTHFQWSLNQTIRQPDRLCPFESWTSPVFRAMIHQALLSQLSQLVEFFIEKLPVKD